METTTHPAKIYWRNCAALMLLLALTWTIGYINLGIFNVIIALAIAIIKALLVALFFMHVKYTSEKMTKAVLLAAVFWLILLLALSLVDYSTRFAG